MRRGRSSSSLGMCAGTPPPQAGRRASGMRPPGRGGAGGASPAWAVARAAPPLALRCCVTPGHVPPGGTRGAPAPRGAFPGQHTTPPPPRAPPATRNGGPQPAGPWLTRRLAIIWLVGCSSMMPWYSSSASSCCPWASRNMPYGWDRAAWRAVERGPHVSLEGVWGRGQACAPLCGARWAPRTPGHWRDRRGISRFRGFFSTCAGLRALASAPRASRRAPGCGRHPRFARGPSAPSTARRRTLRRCARALSPGKRESTARMSSAASLSAPTSSAADAVCSCTSHTAAGVRAGGWVDGQCGFQGYIAQQGRQRPSCAVRSGPRRRRSAGATADG